MFVLYSYFRSSCSWRVRLVLALKKLPYEYRPVNLLKGDQADSQGALIHANPMAQVPALVVDDSLTLSDSSCICEFLEESHPHPSLLPSDLRLRAKVRLICSIIASGIQPLQNLGLLQRLAVLAPQDPELKGRWARDVIGRGLKAVEKVLEDTSGSCCVGDEVTMADCFLVPQVYNARRFQVDLTPFPTVTRVCQHLEQLPVFQLAHPSRQPDCPPELR